MLTSTIHKVAEIRQDGTILRYDSKNGHGTVTLTQAERNLRVYDGVDWILTDWVTCVVPTDAFKADGTTKVHWFETDKVGYSVVFEPQMNGSVSALVVREDGRGNPIEAATYKANEWNAFVGVVDMDGQ